MENTALKIIKVVNLHRFIPETHNKTEKKYKAKVEVRDNSEEIHIHRSDIYLDNNLTQKTKFHSDSLIKGYENDRALTKENDINVSESHVHSNLTKSDKDSLKSKVKFRKCSHTQEELSKLTEHCDETLIKLGDVFDSRESFRQYIYDKAKSWFYYYVCRNSKNRIMEYNCICTAYNVKPRDVIIRQQKQRTTACPCKIRLTSDQSTKKLTVYYVCNHHDHDLTEEAFHQYPHTKHLPQTVKEEFLDLAYLGLDVNLIQKYVHSVAGVTIKKKDINSYIYKFRRNIFQRSLTAERRKTMNHLILSIKSTYDTTFKSIKEKSAVICKVQSGKCTSKRGAEENITHDNLATATPPSEIFSKSDSIVVTNSDSGNSFLDILGTDLDTDTQIVVQYVNEEGILCDEDGTPITNSSAIIQFINNCEYITPDHVCLKEEYSQEDTVFGETADSIDKESYTNLDVNEPLLEKANVICCAPVTQIKGEISITDEVAHELFVQTTEGESSDQDKSDDNQENEMNEPEKRLSPAPQNPGLYAEMENFEKHYFVDHRYIKYDGDGNERDKKSADRRGTIFNRHIPAILAHNVKIYRPPLRYCTGHEQLTLLKDPAAITAGAKFRTHSLFLKYINERASRWYFYYSLLESGKSPEYYVYKCVYGQQRVARNAYRSKGLRKRSNLEKTQCPCQIRLRRLDPVHLTVLYSCNHHDHALDRDHFEAQQHSRRLAPHIKEEIKDLLYLGVSYDVLRQHLMAETGHRLYDKYLHNVKTKMRRNNEERQFTEERLMVLTDKIKELQTLYGNGIPATTEGRRGRKRKTASSNSRISDHAIPVVLNQGTTRTIEYLEIHKIDDVAEEVCIEQEDSCTSDESVRNKRSRLETCLQNLSSQEETLNVMELQSVRRKS